MSHLVIAKDVSKCNEGRSACSMSFCQSAMLSALAYVLVLYLFDFLANKYDDSDDCSLT